MPDPPSANGPPAAPCISVIVPTLNEKACLAATLDALVLASGDELIVVDAGSTDGTPDIARRYSCRFYRGPRGRAQQMNFGARHACGDILLFLARLTLRADGSSTGRHGFYLVGYLDIDSVLSDVQSEPGRDEMARFQANAHVRRGLTDPELWDRFWVFSGSTRSRRFRKAVPVTRELADRVFTSADGSPWRWGGGRSDLQVIGSYTRSCRCVIDPATSEGERRARLLWEWVGEYGG